MRSSQYENLILEYRQDKTAEKLGQALIDRFQEDAEAHPSILTPKTQKLIDTINDVELGPLFTAPKEGEPEPTEEEQAKIAEQLATAKNQLAIQILSKLEEVDPTKNKQYVQWLARTYSKIYSNDQAPGNNDDFMHFYFITPSNNNDFQTWLN
jgi:hypothetical protein